MSYLLVYNTMGMLRNEPLTDLVCQEIADRVTAEIERYNQKRKAKKKVTYVGTGKVGEHFAITCILQGMKSKAEMKPGKHLAYTYNLDVPELSKVEYIRVNQCFGEFDRAE